MRRDGQGKSGDSASGDAAEDDIDQGLRAIIEGDGGAAWFREPSADERDKLAKQARRRPVRHARRF
jgi:hypothetical protein